MSSAATIDGVDHHEAHVNGTVMHYVSSGAKGSPVLLVHGFPETWWTFHKLIPLLSKHHRVFAVDLRGFGDSAVADANHNSTVAAADLAALVADLNVGPVHLTGQDISGPTTFRVAASRPELVRSYTAIETGLPGYGMERLADVTRGGAWHIGVLAAPGIPEMLLAGRERAFLAEYAFPSLNRTPGAISTEDGDEFVRSYARAGGFRGAAGLYRSMLVEGDEIKKLGAQKLAVPVLAVGGRSGDFPAVAMRNVATHVRAVALEGVGHYLAMEAPVRLAKTLTTFYGEVQQL